MAAKLPNETSRTTLVGRTGTGKTVAGLWHLSNQNLERPWVLFNFKNDEHIDSIPNTQEIGWDYIPKKKDKGLFVLRPMPFECDGQNSPLEQYIWKLWARENVGIFCDETFMVGARNKAFNACLTQGRSKRIPMIMCTQRPVMITLFAFSEASFIQVFDLNDDRDIETVEGFVPIDWDNEPPLGPHQSYYFEVGVNKLSRFNPTPPMSEIRKTLEEKTYRKWVLV